MKTKEEMIEDIKKFKKLNGEYDLCANLQIGTVGLKRFVEAGFDIIIRTKDNDRIYTYVDMPICDKPFCYWSISNLKELREWIKKYVPHKEEVLKRIILEIIEE